MKVEVRKKLCKQKGEIAHKSWLKLYISWISREVLREILVKKRKISVVFFLVELNHKNNILNRFFSCRKFRWPLASKGKNLSIVCFGVLRGLAKKLSKFLPLSSFWLRPSDTYLKIPRNIVFNNKVYEMLKLDYPKVIKTWVLKNYLPN